MALFGNTHKNAQQKSPVNGGFFYSALAMSFLSSTFSVFFSDGLRLLPLSLPSSIKSTAYSSIRILIQPAIGIEIIAPTRPKV